MVPLISSICYGPLEICQLPRFWWKVLLRKAGIMDEEYPDCSGGLDASVLAVLELDKDTALGYLRENTPDYLQFEAWVLEQKGGNLDRDAINKWNESVRTRKHSRQSKLDEVFGDIGIEDDGKLRSAVTLNSMQDWQLFHKRNLNSGFSAFNGQVVPLISTLDHGRIGAYQLPRTWLKVLLEARSALHPDYPDCGGGLDARILTALNLDREKTLDYLRTGLPAYTDFEDWVVEQNNGRIDRAKVEACNQAMVSRIHTDAKREDIFSTLKIKDDRSIGSAVVLNHIEDWKYAHNGLMAAIG